MREITGDELLALPVRLHGIQLGRPVDLLLDRDAQRIVGLDVLCGDEVHRFLSDAGVVKARVHNNPQKAKPRKKAQERAAAAAKAAEAPAA